MYTVIGLTNTRAFRVLWMLEELGQDYAQVQAGPGSDEAKRYNPLGKIPILLDDAAILTDSVAIMTYLADKHGALTAPAGTPERARQDATTFWLIDEMDALLWHAAKHTYLYPKVRREVGVSRAMAQDFERSMAQLDSRLGDQPFLMGDGISVPDILAVHCIGWGYAAEFPKASDRVKAYSKRLRQRPAYKAATNR